MNGWRLAIQTWRRAATSFRFWRHLGLGGLFVEHRGGTLFGSADKLALIRKNSETISRRYPAYDADVQDFIRQDLLNTPAWPWP